MVVQSRKVFASETHGRDKEQQLNKSANLTSRTCNYQVSPEEGRNSNERIVGGNRLNCTASVIALRLTGPTEGQFTQIRVSLKPHKY